MTENLYAPADLTAKARIREAAMELIAERGTARTSVRAIAERSDVSAGLVLHHFGSKQGVFDEVDKWVTQILRNATQESLETSNPADAHAHRMAALDRMVARVPFLGGYLRQLLLDTSPAGLRWFTNAVRLTAEDLRVREEEGLARPSSDREAESAMLLLLSWAPVLLQPFLEAALQMDPNSDEGQQRWRRAQTELLTSALYPPEPPVRPPS